MLRYRCRRRRDLFAWARDIEGEIVRGQQLLPQRAAAQVQRPRAALQLMRKSPANATVKYSSGRDRHHDVGQLVVERAATVEILMQLAGRVALTRHCRISTQDRQACERGFRSQCGCKFNGRCGTLSRAGTSTAFRLTRFSGVEQPHFLVSGTSTTISHCATEQATIKKLCKRLPSGARGWGHTLNEVTMGLALALWGRNLAGHHFD